MQQATSATGRIRPRDHWIALPLRVGVAMVVAMTVASVWVWPAAAAEPIATEEHRAGDNSADDSTESANAGNGGTATAMSGGEVAVGQIITGENTGNTIITGNISGSADISGGEIDYPTDVNVSLDNAPLVADASGGDTNEASATDKDEANANNDGETDVKVINTNNNRSSATITTAPAP